VDVGSFSSYIYLPTPWAKHTKTTVRGASSLGNPLCSKLYFSPLSLVVAVAAAVAAAVVLPSSAILFSATSKAVYHVPTDLQSGRVLFLFLFLATEQIDSYSCPRSQRLSPLVPAILTLSHAVCPHACNHPLRLPAKDACCVRASALSSTWSTCTFGEFFYNYLSSSLYALLHDI